MSGHIPAAKQQFFDANGDPLAGGSVYFYIPSTSTPKNTWGDAALSVLNTNPVVLDGSGMAAIYGVGSYRQVVQDALAVTIWDSVTEAPAFVYRGTWATSTAYEIGDCVTDGAAGDNTGNVYSCNEAHTSGTWATDLAASKWTLTSTTAALAAQLAAATAAASSATISASNASTSASNAATSATTATTAVANALTYSNNASSSASAAAASSSSASTSANTATTQASNAAVSATASATSATASAASEAAALASQNAAATSETNAANSATSASASATTATTEATNAANSASAASTSATNAAASAVTASTQATNAAASATAAAASAVDASTYAAALSGTSTTSLTIGTGSKSFTTQAGKQFIAGGFITASETGTPSNYMHGQITSYSGTSLIVDVLDVGGSGTIATWTLTLAGTQGPAGAAGANGSIQITDATGTADGITATYSPVIGSLVDKTLAALVNTAGPNTVTVPTFNPNTLGAQNIVKLGGNALVPGDTGPIGYVLLLEYNLAGTRWELLNPASNATPWVVAGGTADALTATYSPAVPAVYDGQLLAFRAASANTTSTPTFAPSGLTARTIVRDGGNALVPGDIPGALAECLVRYNSANTRWELLNPAKLVLASAKFFVGNSDGVASGVDMSGDATLANTGEVTVTKLNGTAYLARLHATALSF